MSSLDPPLDVAIQADNISKKFLLGTRSSSLKDRLTGFGDRDREEFWAFEDVSLTVPRGSMLGVIGRNGSGKSTLLRTLCGVYRPTTGQVMVRGRITALLELGAGFHGELTGRENIYMNGAVAGLDRDYMDSVIDDIIEMADIGSFLDAPIETYSSGMRARLGFAVSVQMQPEILLADEITAVGDIAFKEHGLRRMNELREGGATIIQVSHSLKMLEKNCDQILWLHHGRVRRLGNPAEVIEEYEEAGRVDTSGRMIGLANPEPPKRQRRSKQSKKSKKPTAKDRRHQREALVVKQSKNDANAEWFKRARFKGEDGGHMVVGQPARFAVKVVPEVDVIDPTIEIRVLNEDGSPTGFGFDSGPLDPEGFDGPIVVSVESLSLPAGRFTFRVDLLSAGEVLATFRKRAPVRSLGDDAEFMPMAASWGSLQTTDRVPTS